MCAQANRSGMAFSLFGGLIQALEPHTKLMDAVATHMHVGHSAYRPENCALAHRVRRRCCGSGAAEGRAAPLQSATACMAPASMGACRAGALYLEIHARARGGYIGAVNVYWLWSVAIKRLCWPSACLCVCVGTVYGSIRGQSRCWTNIRITHCMRAGAGIEAPPAAAHAAAAAAAVCAAAVSSPTPATTHTAARVPTRGVRLRRAFLA